MTKTGLRAGTLARAFGAVVLLILAALPASAATQQSGLVNVALVGNTVQVPVSVAANICNVQYPYPTDVMSGSVTDICGGDADQNGFDDVWEYRYFGNISSQNQSGDF